ncbi:TPA: hypothetical protein ACRMWJ_005758 [Pseudomonas aeruginosa]
MDGSARYTTANLHVYLLRCLAGMSNDFGIDPARLCLGLGFEIEDLDGSTRTVLWIALVRKACKR